MTYVYQFEQAESEFATSRKWSAFQACEASMAGAPKEAWYQPVCVMQGVINILQTGVPVSINALWVELKEW